MKELAPKYFKWAFLVIIEVMAMLNRVSSMQIQVLSKSPLQNKRFSTLVTLKNVVIYMI
jgi:hypothetical protein